MNEVQVSIIHLWHVILVPLQGDVSDRHAEVLTDQVLQRIADHGPIGLVVDLSGVALIDSHLCATVANLAAAARLMGTESYVSGISPEIALTLETMGVSFHRIATTRNLEDALARFQIGPRSPDKGGHARSLGGESG